MCTFAANNGLTLNRTKCEVVLISPSKPATTAPIATLEGDGLTPQPSAKCLGYWWCWDLSATKAVDEVIKKARRAFFAFGAMRTFHGNPISGRSIYETCVIPTLLFKEARRAFFASGAMGAFHCQLNLISGRSIYETCVIPTLLFGCETGC